MAYLSITLALDCDFFLCACLCFRLAVGLDFVVFLVYDTPCHPPVVGHISSQLVWYKIIKTRNWIIIPSSVPLSF